MTIDLFLVLRITNVLFFKKIIVLSSTSLRVYTIIIQFTIQEMAFRLCTKQSAGKNSQEGKQLEFAQLDKFALWKLALRNLMFLKHKSVTSPS